MYEYAAKFIACGRVTVDTPVLMEVLDYLATPTIDDSAAEESSTAAAPGLSRARSEMLMLAILRGMLQTKQMVRKPISKP